MFFLTPKFIKQGRLYIKEAEKRLAYNRDRWTPEVISTFEGEIKRLTDAVKSRDRVAAEVCEKSLDKLCGQHCPLGPNAGIAENVEVILVAIIVALGIRTYFLQPFTIPTSSMSPTLKGITGKATTEEPPNFSIRAYQTAAYGRSWYNVVAAADETITHVGEEIRRPFPNVDEDDSNLVRKLYHKFRNLCSPYKFFTYTQVKTSAGNTYWIGESVRPVSDTFGIQPGRTFQKGEPIARGYIDTGDHVFVDKFSYHFRKPSRGEVFVFLTQYIDIPGYGVSGPPPMKPSQFYIKRLGGLPGDELRIAKPELFHNGHRAEEPGFVRVMTGKDVNTRDGDVYHGYSNSIGRSFDAYGLHSPDAKFRIPERNYFALGDNSYNSSDSRAWGTVPEKNLMGPGFFVYWPFLRDRESHFGLIK